MSPTRIGILGGTFDPVHLGHLVPTQYAYQHLGLERVLFVPSAAPVHRPHHAPAPAHHRLRMCELAVRPLPPFVVSDVEIMRPEPSYTFLTLRQLSRTFPAGSRLYLLVGEDNLPLLHAWRHLEEIVSLATVVPLPRPGPPQADLERLRGAIGSDEVDRILARRIPAPALPVSGTDVRERIRAGRPIRGLVPASVARYIADAALY